MELSGRYRIKWNGLGSGVKFNITTFINNYPSYKLNTDIEEIRDYVYRLARSYTNIDRIIEEDPSHSNLLFQGYDEEFIMIRARVIYEIVRIINCKERDNDIIIKYFKKRISYVSGLDVSQKDWKLSDLIKKIDTNFTELGWKFDGGYLIPVSVEGFTEEDYIKSLNYILEVAIPSRVKLNGSIYIDKKRIRIKDSVLVQK